MIHQDENILDYSTGSSSDTDDGNNVIGNGKLNTEKAAWDRPGIWYTLHSARIAAIFCL